MQERYFLFPPQKDGGEKKLAKLAPTGVWGCLHYVDQVKVKLQERPTEPNCTRFEESVSYKRNKLPQMALLQLDFFNLFVFAGTELVL